MGILMLLERGIQHTGARKLPMPKGWWLYVKAHTDSGFC